MRPFWHYHFKDLEGNVVRHICDDQLKYRLKFHGKIFYSRSDAISTLMRIEKQKEEIYNRKKCTLCMDFHYKCICRKKKSYA